MTRALLPAIAAAILALVLGAAAVRAEPADEPAHGATRGQAVRPEPAPNLMHPLFAPLDANGAPIARSGRPASSVRTCGACHDAERINATNDHWNDRVRAECVACHFLGGRFPTDASAYDADGRLVREAVRISKPRDENCAACHALVHEGQEPLRIPADFGTGGAGIEPLAAGDPPSGAASAPSRTDALTMLTGAIVSDQDVSASLLNLSGKEGRNYPWDAHARRLVGCVSCHYAGNDPMRTDAKTERPGYLAQDPRRITLSEYLRSPDHRLAAAACRSCHAPLEVHRFLPYVERHLAVLDCKACHVSRLLGPAARMIDSTVVTAAGGPAILWRGVEPKADESLNTAYATGYRPLLARLSDGDAGRKLTPVNAVETWSWRSGGDGGSGAGGMRVPWRTVRAAYFEGAAYAPAVTAAFDADHDGALSREELRLDTPDKTELVRGRLAVAGVVNPRIAREVALHPIDHGVLSREQVSRDCLDCHANKGSRITAGLDLSSYCPGGSGASGLGPVAGYAAHVRLTASGTRIEPDAPRGAETLGHARGGWSDKAGFLLFVAVVLGAVAHGGIRFATRKGRRSGHTPLRRVYMYTRYERAWHWLMAASVLVLLVTGLQVHFAGVPAALPLPIAVRLHNIFAVLLTVNAFLSLFYHMVSSTIARFFPDPDGLPARMVEQVRFYVSGIFLGRPHPSPKTPERRLNPLQQITYLLLLNVLFPLQVVTGVLIWAASASTAFAERIGGLTALAPLHNFGAWLLLAFIVLHVYLATTGHSVFSNLRAMATGYDEIEAAHAPAGGGSHG